MTLEAKPAAAIWREVVGRASSLDYEALNELKHIYLTELRERNKLELDIRTKEISRYCLDQLCLGIVSKTDVSCQTDQCDIDESSTIPRDRDGTTTYSCLWTKEYGIKRTKTLLQEIEELKERIVTLESELEEATATLEEYQAPRRELARLRGRDRSQTPCPRTLGRHGEEIVKQLLKIAATKNIVVVETNEKYHHADFTLIYYDGPKCLGYALIDAKNYQKTVGTNQVRKLEKDIMRCYAKYGDLPLWSAIISLNTRISHSSTTSEHAYNFSKYSPVYLIHSIESRDAENDIRRLLDMGKLSVEVSQLMPDRALLTDNEVAYRDISLDDLRTGNRGRNDSLRSPELNECYRVFELNIYPDDP